MNYEITVNQLNKGDGNIRAFVSVVFAESFKVSNIAVIENKDGQCFVSMPRYASSKDDSGYKDICHPITKEFREELYEGIMKAYEQVQQIEENRLQLKISQVDQEKSCDTILILSQEALFCYPHHFRLLYSPQHSWGIRLFI